MKLTALVVVGIAALAGCGGGDDENSADSGGDGDATVATTTGPATPAKGTAKPPYTVAEVVKAVDLHKEGDHYAWASTCTVKNVAVNKEQVDALKKAADDPAKVIPNKSGTVAFEIVQRTYPCAVRASLNLRLLP